MSRHSTRPTSARRALIGAFVLASLLAAGCDPPNAGGVNVEPPASAEAVANAAATTGGAVATLAAPLSAAAGAWQGDPDGPDDTQAVAAMEAALAHESFVTDPTCVSLSWERLVATISFADCVLAEGGQRLDGDLTLSLALRPTALTLTLGDLTLGESTFAGSVAIAVSGSLQDPVVTLTATLTYRAGEEVSVEMAGVTLTATGGTVTLDGEGHLTTATLDTDFTLAGLTWSDGDCLPSAGSVAYQEGAMSVTITFYEDTPQTGVVGVKTGQLPTRDIALLTPCA